MAPATESNYFPSLDKCVAGDSRLISWRTAYRALADEEAALDGTHLKEFLEDAGTIAVLSKPFEPFPAPSTDSKRQFETFTAPCNVPQNGDGDYKLDQLKADAKWLSEELQIDELAALRMAVVEWQERPQDQLLNTAMNGIRKLASTADLASSTLARSTLNFAPPPAALSRPAMDFSDEHTRRKRLLEVYMSEKNYALRLCADLVSRTAISKSELQGHGVGALRLHIKSLDEVAKQITTKIWSAGDGNSSEGFCVQCIQGVESTLKQMTDQTSWPKVFLDEPEQNGQKLPTLLNKQQDYLNSQHVQLISTLRLLLAGLHALQNIPTKATVETWFKMMYHNSFLQQEMPLFETIDVAQLLVSVISVEIMKLQLVVAEILNAAGMETQSLRGGRSYIQDRTCIQLLSEIFYEVTNNAVVVAAPATLAWSIIASVVKDIADMHKDMRVAQHEQRDATLRRGSRDDGPRSQFEELFEESVCAGWPTQSRDVPTRLAKAAVDQMDVFGVMTQLVDIANDAYGSEPDSATGFICKEAYLDLIRESLPLVQYDGTTLGTILAILTPVMNSEASRQQAGILAGKVLHDADQFRPAVIDQALMRYPYELSPMLRLFKALASTGAAKSSGQDQSDVVQLLESLSSYTQVMPHDLRAYELQDETNNTNHIELTQEFPIFNWRKELLHTRPGNEQRFLPTSLGDGERQVALLNNGTRGTVLSDSKPLVVRFDHEHSALEYLGLLLSTFAGTSQLQPTTSRAQLDRFTTTEIVALITALLSNTGQGEANTRDALFILDRLSCALVGQQQDIVSIVAEIFEAELLAHLNQEVQQGSLELAIACAEFFTVLVRVSPERVWSILVRSSLLGVSDGVPSLVQVVLSETQLQHFQFLKACVELHSLLLDDAIGGLIKRKAPLSKAANRFAPAEDSQDSTSDRTMSQVMSAYQKILFDVLQNLPDWKFQVPQERSAVVVGTLDSFVRLLKSTYGIDISKEPSKRLTNVLAPAAQSLLGVCAPKSGVNVIAEAFSRIFLEAEPVAEDGFSMQVRRSLIEQTNSIFRFLTLLVRVTKSGLDLVAKKEAATTNGTTLTQALDLENNSHTQRKASEERVRTLSIRILRDIPILATLLGSDHAFKVDMFPLLAEVVQSAALGGEDPPSILAPLEPEAQKAFLMTLTQLDRPLCDIQVERCVWDFLAAIMDSKQQWFAVYVLLGQLPHKAASRTDDGQLKGKPILGYALDQLGKISTMAPERAVGMLRFIASAQRSWAWATKEVRTHSEFFKKTLAWVETLGIAVRDQSTGASIISAKECQMAAYFCDILSLSLHASLEIGDDTVLQALIPKLAALRDHAVTVNAYNKSLQRNLAKNLQSKFPSSELADFQRSKVNPASYGTDYFYDRALAGSVLRHDKHWRGKNSQGFDEEFARANANLSLLHAQIRLLESWKTLATTLCECADNHARLRGELAKVAERCLSENANPQLDEPGAADVLALRIELVFVLTSRLVSLRADTDAMLQLLPAAWALVRTSPVDYDIATAAEDVKYYRELLQVLYLSIQPHIYSRTASQTSSGKELLYLDPAVASILVDIVGRVIAPGFRALCANLHNDIELALPADFALLTALLKAVLAVPEVSSVHALMADVIAGSSVVRGALSLYSWADRLAEATSHDPIYGEVAVTFLLALSTVRPISEQMALSGVLTQLASANLSNYFRKSSGKGPFDEPSRMFVIWTEGLLPLCLNLLDGVGAPLAQEVSAFLNSFPEQLHRAERALQNASPSPREPKAGTLTLSLVSEAHSLTLIALILKSDMALGAAEGINAADIPALEYDVDHVVGTAEALLRGRRTLADRLAPTSMLEERWHKTPAGDGSNILLGRVVKELESMLSSFGDSES